jgi:hypothetical protein
MARAPVVQIQCDRCKRVDLVPADKVRKDEVPSLELTFRGEDVVFGDLCPRCATAIGNLVASIRDYEREIKQGFLGGPQIAKDEAPPLQVAPSYSPPQPHAAGAKR